MEFHEQIYNGSRVCHNGFLYWDVLFLWSSDDEGDGAKQRVAITGDVSDF